MHKLLARQLRRHIGAIGEVPAFLGPFLDAVDAAYTQWDAERGLLEHSIETVSAEFVERYRQHQSLEEQLRQSQKMEAIGRLAGGVAHDFNNLMTGVIFNARMLLEDTDLSAQQRQAIVDVDRAAQRASDLTRQLLAFSRTRDYRPESVDLNDVIRELEGMLVPLLTENIQLVCDLDPHACTVNVDRAQFEDAIINLTLNARDAMHSGGVLSVETQVDGDPGTKAGCVVLTVRDTGHGMDAATRERIFEPFFTTKPAGSGTGLGLTMVYGIVKRASGDIQVESAPGHGTCFRITLDRSPSAPVQRRLTPAHPVRKLARSLTVLVVEDEALVRDSVRRALEKVGYVVREARHAKDAIQVFEQDPTAVDVVISDVIMPSMSGPDLLKHLRSIKPDLKAILMSGYTNGALSGDSLRATGARFLQKPFKPAALLRALDEELGIDR